MRILLIKPRWFHNGDGYKFVDLTRVAPLNLGIIAALSEGHEVKIIDEDMESIAYSSEWDIAGITVATFTSKKAYEISNNFRSLGVKTVLGGIHPSLMPDECLQHADAVVIGEAENVWTEVLDDISHGSLKKIYHGGYIRDLDKIPFPRRDLFPKQYFSGPLQITRGCVNACRYCYLQSVPWKEWRKRENLDRVCEEIRQIENKNIFIIDDNLFVDLDYAKRVCESIAPLKRNFGIQAPTTIAKDDELLEKLKCWLL